MDICKKHYRIKSRSRFIAFVAISFILCIMLLNSMLGTYNATGMTIVEYRDIQVTYGDTLWNIAAEYMPADMDTRRAVYKLCQINDITADDVVPGMTLQIPVYN